MIMILKVVKETVRDIRSDKFTDDMIILKLAKFSLFFPLQDCYFSQMYDLPPSSLLVHKLYCVELWYVPYEHKLFF